MRLKSTRAVHCLAAALTTAVVAGVALVPVGAWAEDDAWTIGSRSVGLPEGGSDALRASLRSDVAPDISVAIAAMPASDDIEGWRELQAAVDADLADETRKLLDSTGTVLDERVLAGVPVFVLTPPEVLPENADRIFVFTHGGAYVYGSGLAGVYEGVLIAVHGKIPVLSIDYRMPPDHPFPAAQDDVIAVWTALLRERDATSMALGGTSAGAGLALSAVQRMIADGLPTPSSLLLGSPWADITDNDETLHSMSGIDRILIDYDVLLRPSAELYANGRDMAIPGLSPLYGSFEGMPPAYVISGTRDMFLSASARVHREFLRAGNDAELHIFDGISHAEFILPDLPEAREAYEGLGAFLLAHFP